MKRYFGIYLVTLSFLALSPLAMAEQGADPNHSGTDSQTVRPDGAPEVDTSRSAPFTAADFCDLGPRIGGPGPDGGELPDLPSEFEEEGNQSRRSDVSPPSKPQDLVGKGRELFQAKCQSCHGNGSGPAFGAGMSFSQAHSRISSGSSGNSPTMKASKPVEKLSASDKEAILAYLATK